MPRGPIPKPDALRVDKRNRAPKPSRSAGDSLTPLEAPADLDVELVPLWEASMQELALSRGGSAAALRSTDAEICLRPLLEAVWLHKRASEALHTEGLTVQGRFGPMPNPMIRAQQSAAGQIRLLATELGLSPAARVRLGLQLITGASLMASIDRELGIVRDPLTRGISDFGTPKARDHAQQAVIDKIMAE